MTLKEKYNKISENIFSLGSHTRSKAKWAVRRAACPGDGEGENGCGPHAYSSQLNVGDSGGFHRASAWLCYIMYKTETVTYN